MAELEVTSFRQEYGRIIDWVLDTGIPAAPRGMGTREVVGATIVFADPVDSLLVGVGRKLNVKLAALEAIQLIGGFSDPRLMVQAAPNTGQFIDGGIFRGAYGPRIAAQLPAVVRRLKNDADSRQAQLNIWDPALDLFTDKPRDIPCTTSLQFLLRNDALHMIVVMRSNDVWWGLTFDIFAFSQLQLTLANVLGAWPGTYTHHAGSLHIYDRDHAALQEIVEPDGPCISPVGLGEPRQDIIAVMDHALELTYAGAPVRSETDAWYAEWLGKINDVSA